MSLLGPVTAFVSVLQSVCQQDTAMFPALWSQDNPTAGHCGVAASLIQQVYGGDIVIVKFHTPKGGSGRHFFNIMPDGTRIDATRSQFGPAVIFTPPDTADNETLLKCTRQYLQEVCDFDGSASALLRTGNAADFFKWRCDTVLQRMTAAFSPTPMPISVHPEDVARRLLSHNVL